MELSVAERKLLAFLLDRAGKDFSNHGCNDLRLRLDAGLTPVEAEEIQGLLHARNDDPDREPPAKGDEYAMDWLCMLYFEKKLREGL